MPTTVVRHACANVTCDQTVNKDGARCKMCTSWWKQHGQERKGRRSLETDGAAPGTATNEALEASSNAASAPDAQDSPTHAGEEENAVQGNVDVQSTPLSLEAAQQALAAAKKALACAKAAQKQERQAAYARARAEYQITPGELHPLDGHQSLRDAICLGGAHALTAMRQAIETGQVVIKARKTRKKTDGAHVARVPGRKLTDEEIDAIQKRLRAGEAPAALAEAYTLHRVTISAIASGRIRSKATV